ncbi:MAG TPA: AsmA family protein, partial [Burkholderiales bacterium]|nr:AsmA family protein [Burkholderiales bacterium]
LDVDTSDSNISGSGSVNLRDETLDLTLTPLPKNPSVLSLRAPLHLTGSFAAPDIGVDKPTVALRAGGALLLGAFNPLAALLPLIEPGPGRDSDCAGLGRTLAAEPHDARRSGHVRAARAPSG